MNTKAKSNSVITHEIESDGIIVFNVLGAGKISFDLASVNAANKLQAMTHGFIQRISDAAAISRDPETGKPATPEEKFEAMLRLVKHYESGASEWRIAGVGGVARSSVLLDAMVQLYPTRTRDDLKAWLGAKSKTQRAALARSSRVAPIIAAMTPVSGDADAMLDELDQAE